MLCLGTFNMRTETGKDGPNHFEHRKNAIVTAFNQRKPLIMGLQEITDDMLTFLKRALPQYSFAGCGRFEDFTDEHCVIAYLRDEVTLHALDTFWLSPTPNVPGSLYPGQSDCPRVCTWARFYHEKSGTLFAFYNTHLDHVGTLAREEGLSQILSLITQHQKEEPLPFFLVGDFNFQPFDQEHRLIENSPLGLQNLVHGLSRTAHGFNRQESSCIIDYILTNVKNQPFPLTVWYKSPDEVFYSDHVGLMVDWAV